MKRGEDSAGREDAEAVCVESRQLLLDAFFKVEEVTLRHRRRDGSMSASMRRLHIDRGHGAAILLHDPVRQVVYLVRQFRYPAWIDGPGWLLETVAGVIEPGREPEEVARQEAWEEAGFRLERIEKIGSFYLTPGGSCERIFLFYATVDTQMRQAQGGGLEAEGEDIEVMEVSLAAAFAAVDAGEICDAKTMIALQWLRNRVP